MYELDVASVKLLSHLPRMAMVSGSESPVHIHSERGDDLSTRDAIHPDPVHHRSLTLRGSARHPTFPEDYFFEETRTGEYVEVGNAVPLSGTRGGTAGDIHVIT
jgi:site-specific DNA-cytosine methylase